jgi:potassium-dependent mechanosensitive channel
MLLTHSPSATSRGSRLRALLARVTLTWLIAVGAAGFAFAAEESATARKPAAEEPKAATAIPVAELSAQAEAATIHLREIGAHAALDGPVKEIETGLSSLASFIDARVRENARIVSQRPSLDLLRTLERAWQRQRDTIDGWNAQLEQRIAALDRDLARLDELDKTWKETHAAALKAQAPAELLGRVDELLAALVRTRKEVESKRAQTLRLQSRVAAQEFRIAESLEAIRTARNVTLNRVMRRDSAPLWESDLLTDAGARIAEDSQESRSTQVSALRSYVDYSQNRFALHALIVALIAFALYRVRRWIAEWSKTEAGLERSAAVFAMPFATALVLSFLGAGWIYPEAPRLLWAIVGAIALIPTILVLRPIVPRYLVPFLYAVVAFYLVDQIRAVTASVELVPRIVFFAEMMAGALFLAWFVRSVARDAPNLAGRPRLRAFILFGARLGCLFFAATAFANAAGYVALANLLGGAALRSLYFGIVLYTLVQIIDALVLIALRVRPLTLLAMVRSHHDLLRRRIRLALNAAAFVLWLSFVLDRLAIRDLVLGGVERLLTAEARFGEISISAMDVLAFVVVVWASFIVSRFIRFILDEEVFPLARLKRGIPYAISRTVHYLILVAGFFVAMAALGLDMTKFTILAGAFTVGVGFGLQNIFNNFVSGLILLFERPVQVGDLVQMDDATGIVQRIGIRASIVRASNGSEIIVPNGKLISERLVNWTFSERQRGIEVGLSVVLDSDPARVIAILERVATGHPHVLKRPTPQALLTRVGPDWMGFELRAATDRVESWMEVRSELAVAAAVALVAEQIKLR